MQPSMAVNPSRVPGHGRIAVPVPVYVGSPVAAAFGKYGALIVVGLDIDQERVAACKDRSNEAVPDELGFARGLFTSGSNNIATSDFYVFAAPTPTAAARRPVLTALTKATEAAGCVLKQGVIVAYEFDRVSRNDRRTLPAHP